MYNAIIHNFHILSNIIYFRWKEALGVHVRHRKRHHVAVYNMVLRWNLQGCAVSSTLFAQLFIIVGLSAVGRPIPCLFALLPDKLNF